MKSCEQTYKELLCRLRRLRRFLQVNEWLTSAALAVIVLACAAVLLPAFALLFRAQGTARWLLSFLFFAAACGALALLLKVPVQWIWRRDSGDMSDLALRVGRAVGTVRDRFANAMQVYREQRYGPLHTVSRSLAEEALTAAAQEIADFEFTSVVDRRPTRRLGTAAVACAGLAVFLWFGVPQFLADGFGALLHPAIGPLVMEEVIQVAPGDTAIIKGESLTVDIRSAHVDRPSARIERRTAGSDYLESSAAMRRAAGHYQYRFENVREEFSYRVLLAGHQSRWFNVRVTELPEVRTLQVFLRFPKYTGLPSRSLEENVGDIQALPGTVATVRVRSNKDLASAHLVFDDGSRVPLTSAGHDLAGSFTVRREATYHVALLDNDRLTNEEAITYRVQLRGDAGPSVRIVFPGQDMDLGEDMRASLLVQAEDDFGFSRLQLAYEIQRNGQGENGAKAWRLPIAAEGRHLQHTVEWDLTTLGLLPDDVVAYYAEVFDNDAVSGPKSARSETYRLRFPSLQEIFQELAADQDNVAGELQKNYEQTRQFKETVDRLVQEMKKDPKINWEQKQKLSQAAGASEKAQQQLQELQQRLDETMAMMEKNDLLSTATLQKYMELQKLMQELTSPQMKKALEELQKAMENLSPQQLEEALKNFQLSQEDLLKNLERTINLLKQVQAEQKLDEAIRRLQEMRARQEEINQQASQTPEHKPAAHLAENEKALKQEAEALQKSLEDLSRQMVQVPQAPAQKIEQAAQMMDSANMGGEMQQMSNQLQQGEMKLAQQTGRRLSQLLQQVEGALRNAQQEMQSNQKRAVMQALQRSSNDLLHLSKSQEHLLKQSNEANTAVPQFNQMADEQQNLMAGLQRVAEQLVNLSQKTFAVTPEVARALGRSMAKMQEALDALEQRSGREAGRGQGEAMQGLDRAVRELREALREMSASSSASGFDQFMQRLLGISGRQQSINQETQQLGEQGRAEMEQRAAVARLAAQQLAVQKSLEQLAAEVGSRSEILGRLDQIAKDMEEVVKDLQNRAVDRQTVERQQRILSRLLDAQRSLRERDFSKERQAETGKTYRTISPGPLPPDLGERASRMQQDLLRALQENYTRDFQQLIQRYFEALSQQERQRAQATSPRP